LGGIIISKFKKKPVVVQGFQFYVDSRSDEFMDKVSSNEIVLKKCNYDRYSIDDAYCKIKTLEGTMQANSGDYIIKGVDGEIYPCKPDIFKRTYEKVKE